MSRPTVLRNAVQLRPYVCARCTFRIQQNGARSIHAKTAARKEREDLEWQAQTRDVRLGKKKSMLSILEERGYVKDIAGYHLQAESIEVLVILTFIQRSNCSGSSTHQPPRRRILWDRPYRCIASPWSSPPIHDSFLAVHTRLLGDFTYWRRNCPDWRSYRPVDVEDRREETNTYIKSGQHAQSSARLVDECRQDCSQARLCQDVGMEESCTQQFYLDEQAEHSRIPDFHG